MATIIQNGITFSNIYKDGGTVHEDTIIQHSWNSNDEYPSDNNFPLVNAVDIDWNGATTTMSDATKVINTSGDLISYLATA